MSEYIDLAVDADGHRYTSHLFAKNGDPWRGATILSPAVVADLRERDVRLIEVPLPGSLPSVAKPKMEVNISFRVSRDLRDAATAKADERQENVSDVLREALERYVKGKR